MEIMPSLLRETFPVGLLACNCTLLGDPGTGEAIVIDPGLAEANGPAFLLSRLAALRLRLTQILITHAHIDHVGGALALRQATGAPILMHQADLPLLAMMDMQANWLGIVPPAVAPPDLSAEDGLRVGLANHAGVVLHTPGHSEGSICIHFPGENLLLAGDTLFAQGIGRVDLPGGDGRKILRSIEARLMPLPGDTLVVPGHGPETTIAAEIESNPFLRGLGRAAR
jgi:hydroxyacylglutathione hydrolase